jgi:hypothetical protein
MPTLRKIFFYFFAAIYLVVCPLLILRLLGFVYNPQQGKFIKTGIIYVSTNPPGANVYINDLKTPETTPTMIRDLVPSNYQVSIKLDGYQDWSNTIPVQARKASVLENILLTPPQWTVKLLSYIPFENLQVLGDDNSLLAFNKKNIKDVFLLRLNKTYLDEINSQNDSSLPSKLFPKEFIYSDAIILQTFTVEKSSFFILHILVEAKDKYIWIDTRDKQIHIEDISDLITQEPLRLWWEADDDKIIYVFYKDQINRINLKSKTIFPDIGFKEVPHIKKPDFKISNLRASVPNEGKNLWLIFTSNKIGYWDKEQKLTQWLFKNGADIQQAFWANNTGTVLFKDNHDIFLLDRESFGLPRMQKITTVASGSSFFYSEKTGKLYFIDNKTSKLCTVQILKHQPIIPKTISDTLRLKNKGTT